MSLADHNAPQWNISTLDPCCRCSIARKTSLVVLTTEEAGWTLKWCGGKETDLCACWESYRIHLTHRPSAISLHSYCRWWPQLQENITVKNETQFYLWLKEWDDKWILQTAFKPHSSCSCTQTDIIPNLFSFFFTAVKLSPALKMNHFGGLNSMSKEFTFHITRERNICQCLGTHELLPHSRNRNYSEMYV